MSTLTKANTTAYLNVRKAQRKIRDEYGFFCSKGRMAPRQTKKNTDGIDDRPINMARAMRGPTSSYSVGGPGHPRLLHKANGKNRTIIQ